MRLDGRDRREQLRSHFAVRPPCCHECRDAPLSARQLAVAPRPRVRPSQLLLGALDPELRSQLDEDGLRGLDFLRRAASLAQAAQRIAGDQQRASLVKREARGLELAG